MLLCHLISQGLYITYMLYEFNADNRRDIIVPVLFAEALELVYMKDESGAVFQVVPFHDKLLASVNSEVGETGANTHISSFQYVCSDAHVYMCRW